MSKDHEQPIPLARPSLDDREIEAVSRVLRSGWITQGPEVAAFEREFASFVGAPHACAVSSCTTALHLALLAVGVKPGDEVITVSHSFIATANAVRYCGARPVFVDIDPATYNLDPNLLDAAASDRTRAVLCVHQMGMPCDLDRIVAWAKPRGVPVVEDAACAIGSRIRRESAWDPVGRPHGDIACFSFHPRKVISTGDGGMLTTRNAQWDAAFRLKRQHGMSVSDTARHAARKIVFESYVEVGYNYRMTDVQASIGREQLRKLPSLVDRRRELADAYRRLLRDIPGLVCPAEPAWGRSNWQSFCVRLPEGADQLGVMQCLLDRGVASRPGVMCSHQEPAYAAVDWVAVSRRRPERQDRGALPESEAARRRCLLLPLYPQMTEADQARVAEVLAAASRPR